MRGVRRGARAHGSISVEISARAIVVALALALALALAIVVQGARGGERYGLKIRSASLTVTMLSNPRISPPSLQSEAVVLASPPILMYQVVYIVWGAKKRKTSE